MARCQLAPEIFNGVTQQQIFRDYGKLQHTTGARFHHTLASLLQICKRACSLWSTGIFACEEAIWPLPNALQAGKLLLPMWPMDPSVLVACSWGFSLPPQQRTSRYLALEFPTMYSPVYRVLMVLRPSPFSLSMFWGTDFLFSPL